MIWHARSRSVDELDALLAGRAGDELTYAPTGGSLSDLTPDGLDRQHWRTVLQGADAFERAVVAVRTWSVHRGAGLTIAADGPIAVGTNVALCAPLPIGFVDATCRIVAVVDEPTRFGFAYGTLSVHPERGEEAFIVSRSAGESVTFEVAAVSCPAHPLARACPPIARRLQDAAVRRYLTAMGKAATDAPLV